MGEFFRGWAMSLAGVIVFGSVCEMLLPGGTYKKYLHLAIGLILILTLVSPFAEGRPDVEFELPDWFAEETSVNPDDRQNADIIRIYKQKLCENIKRKLEPLAGIDFEVKCEVSTEGESFGSIKTVQIIADADAGLRISDAALSALKSDYGLTDESISVKYVETR